MEKLSFRILRVVGTCSILLTSSAFADSTVTHKIQGNPIGRRDDYTINSPKALKVYLSCVFSNVGAKQASLNIWTSPAQSEPRETIHLSAGTENKPYKVKRDFNFELNKRWWCQIYSQTPKKRWEYCTYFSVSDATLAETYPFATWNETIHSKYTHYSCAIKSADDHVNIFYFKR